MYFDKSYTGEMQASFLPAAQYWIDREEAILSYLSMRGCSVPKVILKDTSRKTVRLEDVGTTLFDWVETKSDEIAPNIFWILRTIIEELDRIFEMGVLHLDITARNITVDLLNKRIYILDFGHAVYKNLELLKPIPLLPTLGLQHEVLYKCLIEDWSKYFREIEKDSPSFKEGFAVNDNEFSEYWGVDFSVQKQCSNYGILIHQISNLVQEFCGRCSSDFINRSKLISVSNTLRNLNDVDGKFAKNRLLELLSDNSSKINFSTQWGYQNSTPIPTVNKDQSVSITNKSKIYFGHLGPTFQTINSYFFLFVSLLSVYIVDKHVDKYKVRFTSSEISLIIDATGAVFILLLGGAIIKGKVRSLCIFSAKLIALVLFGWFQFVSIKPINYQSAMLFVLMILSVFIAFYKSTDEVIKVEKL